MSRYKYKDTPIACPHCGKGIFENVILQSPCKRITITSDNSLIIDEESIFLTQPQMDLMKILVAGWNRFISLDTLYNMIYSAKPECDWPEDERTVVVQISRLNSILKDYNLHIINQHSVGYSLEFLKEGELV